MDQAPFVSVVMAVRNAAPCLSATLSSIQAQQGVDLEIVVVNDGSSDATPHLLAEAASQDSRLRVFHRPHRGLTLSLIDGCNAARGEFLARHDAGDRSLPGRLRLQCQALAAAPQAVLCSTHARFLVPEGAVVHQASPRPHDLQDGLTGPAHHGSVMMRTAAYRQAGGYRPMFYYAQDIDLWSRLAESGSHSVVPQVLYEAEVGAGSISGLRSREQRRFHALIRAAALARRQGRAETPWLRRAAALSDRCRLARSDPRRRALGAYFIGACLQPSHPEVAQRYLEEALSHDPWHLRARLRLARWR